MAFTFRQSAAANGGGWAGQDIRHIAWPAQPNRGNLLVVIVDDSGNGSHINIAVNDPTRSPYGNTQGGWADSGTDAGYTRAPGAMVNVSPGKSLYWKTATAGEPQDLWIATASAAGFAPIPTSIAILEYSGAPAVNLEGWSPTTAGPVTVSHPRLSALAIGFAQVGGESEQNPIADEQINGHAPNRRTHVYWNGGGVTTETFDYLEDAAAASYQEAYTVSGGAGLNSYLVAVFTAAGAVSGPGHGGITMWM